MHLSANALNAFILLCVRMCVYVHVRVCVHIRGVCESVGDPGDQGSKHG